MNRPLFEGSIRHLRYFIAAAESGSFRRAALKLSVQEPAISRRVRDLEDHLGASLFHRNSSGVTLTLAGEHFLVSARTVLRQIESAARDVSAVGRNEAGQLRIGLLSSLASGFLPELISRFCKLYDGIKVEFIDGDTAEHVAAIHRLHLDVAFVAGATEWPGCQTDQLWTERVFMALPSEHRLADQEELHWQELLDEKFIVSCAAPGPEIRDYLLRRLADFGHHTAIQVHNVGRDNLLSMVALGCGLTVISEAITSTQIYSAIYRPIADETLPFSAIWSPRNDNPACRRLLSLARSMALSGKTSINTPNSRSGPPVAPSQSPDPSR